MFDQPPVNTESGGKPAQSTCGLEYHGRECVKVRTSASVLACASTCWYVTSNFIEWVWASQRLWRYDVPVISVTILRSAKGVR